MAMNNFIPNEKTVTIPLWMDCRKTNWMVELQKKITDGVEAANRGFAEDLKFPDKGSK